MRVCGPFALCVFPQSPVQIQNDSVSGVGRVVGAQETAALSQGKSLTFEKKAPVLPRVLPTSCVDGARSPLCPSLRSGNVSFREGAGPPADPTPNFVLSWVRKRVRPNESLKDCVRLSPGIL